MVRPEGFEPPTPTFVALYSIQMNYGRMMNLRAYVTFIVDLFRTYRPTSLTTHAMDITWAPVQLATNLQGSSDPPGVEPVPFYYFGSSNLPR